MLPYEKKLKPLSRRLRREMTDTERLLWSRLQRRQLGGTQFYRQKPLSGFIVDFYCPSARLVIEVDGGQHYEPEQQSYDLERSRMLEAMNLRVMRFDNLDVLRNIEDVLEQIYRVVCEKRHDV